jgi:hypothetical protein
MPPGAGGSGFVNNPAPIQSAIGAPPATPGNLAAALTRLEQARARVEQLADENRRLREERERVWRASRGEIALSPAEHAAVAEAGGFNARWWQIQNVDLTDNVARYDAAWQRYQDAQLAVDLLRGQ